MAMVVDGSGNLYIGGSFANVGEVVANRVAKWNGSAWSALGSGLNGQVAALAVSHTDLYVGGDFTIAADKVSAHVARVSLAGNTPPTLTITRTSTNTVLVSWPSPSTDFTLQQTPNLSGTSWVTPSETVIDNGSIKYITVNPPSGNRFYRLFKP